MIHRKFNECSETTTKMRTIGDLRKLIEDSPDDVMIYFYSYGTVYDLEAEIRSQDCGEHSGKVWKAEGLVFEVDS